MKQTSSIACECGIHETDNMASGVGFWTHGLVLVLAIMAITPELRKYMYFLF